MYDLRNKIRIACEDSLLAIDRAETVKARIYEADMWLITDIVPVKTAGAGGPDDTTGKADDVAGKADQAGKAGNAGQEGKADGKDQSFRELCDALRVGRADICVHSLSDMPEDVPEDLPVMAYTHRDDPRDVLILPEGARDVDPSLPVGTPDLRTAIQIRELLPDVKTAAAGDSIEDSIRQLDEGQFSALVLAAEEVKRLGFAHRISRYFGPEEIIPAPCQGILAIQGRAGESHNYLSAADSVESMICAEAEQAFVREASAGAGSPYTAYAWVSGDTVNITGMRYDAENGKVIRSNISGPSAEAGRLGAELAHTVMNGVTIETPSVPGKVRLVGAGPGDAMLMTLRGREVLSSADTVIYDSLACDGLMSFIPDSAELICTGGGHGMHVMESGEISRLMLDKALEGKNVVRLFEGDPFVFQEGAEELEALAGSGISYEIVPGVTSAFAAAAYAGIPVTHRDDFTSIHVINGRRRKDGTLGIDFVALTEAGGTLVFINSESSLASISGGLLSADMDPDTPAAVIERCTAASRRNIISTLGGLEKAVDPADLRTPAVIIIGDSAGLADRLEWRSLLPLSGIRTVLTTMEESDPALPAMLREQGAEVIELPAIRIAAANELDGLISSIDDIASGRYEWIVFTGPGSIGIFMDTLLEQMDIRTLSYCRIACSGMGSAEELRKYGIRADLAPRICDDLHLGRELSRRLREGDRVLVPGAGDGSRELVSAISAVKGVTVRELPVCDTEYRSFDWFDAEAVFSDSNTYAVFTSADEVRGLVSVCRTADLSCIRAVCTDSLAAAEAEEYGMQTFIADEATPGSLVSRLQEIGPEVQ